MEWDFTEFILYYSAGASLYKIDNKGIHTLIYNASSISNENYTINTITSFALKKKKDGILLTGLNQHCIFIVTSVADNIQPNINIIGKCDVPGKENGYFSMARLNNPSDIFLQRRSLQGGLIYYNEEKYYVADHGNSLVRLIGVRSVTMINFEIKINGISKFCCPASLISRSIGLVYSAGTYIGYTNFNGRKKSILSGQSSNILDEEDARSYTNITAITRLDEKLYIVVDGAVVKVIDAAASTTDEVKLFTGSKAPQITALIVADNELFIATCTGIQKLSSKCLHIAHLYRCSVLYYQISLVLTTFFGIFTNSEQYLSIFIETLSLFCH